MSGREIEISMPSLASYRGIWWTEPDGVVASELNGLRLVVRFSDEGNGPAQFMVLRPSGKEWVLAGVGNAPDALAVMRSASRMAECLRPHSPRPGCTDRTDRETCHVC
jgi:hypothetical protein